MAFINEREMVWSILLETKWWAMIHIGLTIDLCRNGIQSVHGIKFGNLFSQWCVLQSRKVKQYTDGPIK